MSVPSQAPVGSACDADGRQVALCCESTLVPWVGAPHGWLVAVDGSAHSLRAASEAMWLARAMGQGGVELVNVQPWLAREVAQAELQKRGLADTAGARAMFDSAGQSWRLHVLMGEPAERIAALAETLGSHGIVIGSHGHGFLQSVLLGSVAQQVLKRTQVPVVVVR